ncbi:hypothetical protein EUGRSUZ_H02944 [Eucalyptus grandis]|uniref:Uncharacterized protein n=2 Tax=Eucalyptus grandis TaxID=71139 RepID=A0ACC3JU96_EUCGR|nr:hypothetical protein EUGRSUZ_H02944 [Eucalyptus grandis]
MQSCKSRASVHALQNCVSSLLRIYIVPSLHGKTSTVLSRTPPPPKKNLQIPGKQSTSCPFRSPRNFIKHGSPFVQWNFPNLARQKLSP